MADITWDPAGSLLSIPIPDCSISSESPESLHIIDHDVCSMGSIKRPSSAPLILITKDNAAAFPHKISVNSSVEARSDGSSTLPSSPTETTSSGSSSDNTSSGGKDELVMQLNNRALRGERRSHARSKSLQIPKSLESRSSSLSSNGVLDSLNGITNNHSMSSIYSPVRGPSPRIRSGQILQNHNAFTRYSTPGPFSNPEPPNRTARLDPSKLSNVKPTYQRIQGLGVVYTTPRLKKTPPRSGSLTSSTVSSSSSIPYSGPYSRPVAPTRSLSGSDRPTSNAGLLIPQIYDPKRSSKGSLSSLNLSQHEQRAISAALDREELELEVKKNNNRKGKGLSGKAYTDTSESSDGPKKENIPMAYGFAEASITDKNLDNSSGVGWKEETHETFLSNVEVEAMDGVVPFLEEASMVSSLNRSCEDLDLIAERNANRTLESERKKSKKLNKENGPQSASKIEDRKMWPFNSSNSSTESKVRDTSSFRESIRRWLSGIKKEVPADSQVSSSEANTNTGRLKRTPSILSKLWNSVRPQKTANGPQEGKDKNLEISKYKPEELKSFKRTVPRPSLFQLFAAESGNNLHSEEAETPRPILSTELENAQKKLGKMKPSLEVPEDPLQPYYAAARSVKRRRERLLHEATVLSFWGVFDGSSVLIRGARENAMQQGLKNREFVATDTNGPDMIVGRRWIAEKFKGKGKKLEPQLGEGELKIEEIPLPPKARKCYPPLSAGIRSIRRIASGFSERRRQIRLSWSDRIQEYAGDLGCVRKSGDRAVSDEFRSGTGGGGAMGMFRIPNRRATPSVEESTLTALSNGTSFGEGLDFGIEQSELAGDWATAVQMMEEFSDEQSESDESLIAEEDGQRNKFGLGKGNRVGGFPNSLVTAHAENGGFFRSKSLIK
ncbi:hypothetical protein RUND412_005320 [Rhizina undulata]